MRSPNGTPNYYYYYFPLQICVLKTCTRPFTNTLYWNIGINHACHRSRRDSHRTSARFFIYIYIYTDARTYMYTHTCIYMHTCNITHIHTHTHTYTYIHTYIHIYICVCVCVCVFVFFFFINRNTAVDISTSRYLELKNLSRYPFLPGNVSSR